jgi:hypothetical protein
MATRTRSTQPRKAPASGKTQTKTLTPDSLADAVKTKLRITGEKPKKVTETKLSPAELMGKVNASSAKLSAMLKGDAASSRGGSGPAVEALARPCLEAFKELRSVGLKPLDVERSASSVVAKLIALEQVRTSFSSQPTH